MIGKMRRPAMALFLVAGLGLLGGCAGRERADAPVDAATVQTVRAALLNLLECPSQSCSVVEDLHAGDKVAVLTPEINGWYEVRDLATGRRGYVLARFVGR
ncbi:SH3 domain-containing protein [Solidesulfovibrio sp.]|uniref:SH3 domain-containing protein n=1 Tax=Solidesulfovibrio sp. TaxID=2910990 RepID=UPI002611794A|nr:SH3 domain-containing protein [Solidesulfovibrio sp.]